MRKLKVSHTRMAEKLKTYWPGGKVSTVQAFDILLPHYKWATESNVAYMMFHHPYFTRVDNGSPKMYEQNW